MSQQEVRVRFAPSPTGGLHIGGVRTALYNYLFAKKHEGKFIIRIEDTDQKRFVPGAEEYIYEALEWLGLTPDESPKVGGPYGPYRQSERKEMYRQYAERLVEEGNAYYAFDTEEELEAMRQRLIAAKSKNPSYNAISRMSMKNSLTLPPEEVKARIESGEPYVIRMKVPHKKEIRFKDHIRGWVVVHASALDDKVLLKSDGMPTYHLANIVDDHLMKITHVIRGEEWLPSAPIHVLLYEFFGWQPPEFAHLPLILRPDGNGKLSKRVADQLGFPIFPLTWTDQEGNVSIGYRERGFLPEAIINFLALLGWHPSDNRELFTLEELIQEFSLERITKSGARFDFEKAKWFNQQYLRKKSGEELLPFFFEGLEQANTGIKVADIDKEKAVRICELMKERITFPKDIWEEAAFFFVAPASFDEKAVAKRWNEQAAAILKDFAEKLQAAGASDGAAMKQLLEETATAQGVKIGKVMPALRLAITGQMAGPDLVEILDILGKEEVVKRLQYAIDTLGIPAKS
ncbi:MAG: glutamate--tRNA ligase [Thermonema sp.]|jgi:glutamyl-tRNA synthetase|uniref:glutamate--tRNA ligase n=1 Tax=Thermonema TaxID=28194 RepID=UPI0005707215|nr:MULTISPECIES: glutamate--tRNA ligase [Thermonema]GIV39983.1 MAG: glutamate--tRNA ligase [Thermonema sp.]